MNHQVESTQFFSSGLVNQNLSIRPKIISRPTVMYHLAAKMAGQSPALPGAGLAKAANTRISTMTSRYAPSCHKVRPPFSSSGRYISPTCRAASSLRKIKAISRPVTTAKATAPMARARPSCHPRILAVSAMARTLMAGPEYRKAVAGPIPAPRL